MSKQTTSKKTASTKNAPATNQRLRKAVANEIDQRIERLEQKEHTAFASDGRKVKVSIPTDDAGDAKPAKAPKEKAAKRVSLLDAGYQVLADANGRPMTANEIVDQVIARGLWFGAGKTPDATLYAAMTREIAAKQAAARFTKVGRGLFAANAAAAKAA